MTRLYPVLIYILIFYFWFILSKNLDFRWTLAIISLLIIKYYNKKILKKIYFTDDSDKINRIYRLINTSSNLSLIVLTLIGGITYFESYK